MTASRLASWLAAVTVVLVLPLVAGPVSAEDVTVSDERGDMVKLQEGSEDPQPAPGASVGDVVRTVFRHTPRHVVVRTKLAALTRTGRRFRVWVDIQNGARRTWYVGVEGTPRDRNGHVIFLAGPGEARCPVRHRISYGEDVVHVSVPTRCLHHPRMVRFRLVTEHVRHGWTYAWLDNGIAVPFAERRWTRWLRRE